MTRPGPTPRPGATWLVRVALVLIRHPDLWGTAARQLLVLARRDWWRGPPWLPLPDPAYLRFRLQTAYGDPTREPEPADVVTYLHWCRAWPRVTS